MKVSHFEPVEFQMLLDIKEILVYRRMVKKTGLDMIYERRPKKVSSMYLKGMI